MLRKKVNFKVTAALIILVLMCSISATALARCTTVVVGKKASADGSIYIGRNEDYAGNWAKNLKLNPAHKFDEEKIIVSENGFEWKLPEKTFQYMSVEDANPDLGRFQEVAINTEQLGVSATNSASQNKKAAAADPLVKTGVGENIITTVLAKEAADAREAVKLVGKMVENQGAAECFALAVADPGEAWIIEVGGGHHWAAARVPDNKYLILANALRIGEVDLNDQENYLGSADLIEFAKKHELYDYKNEPFNFAKAYGTAEDYKEYNYRRVWGGINYFTSSLNPDPEAKNYPLFVKPDQKIKLSEIMSFLRYHYQESEYDPLKNGVDQRAPGTLKTIESHVVQLRDNLPNPIAGITWLAMSSPLGSVYIPYYSGIDQIPAAYTAADSHYDSKSAYWAFRELTNLAYSHNQLNLDYVQGEWQDFEEYQFKIQAKIEKLALNLYYQNPELGIDFLTEYSNDRALKALHTAYQMRDQIKTDFSQILLKDYN
ncbi:C69 family dipeptidase [Halanaerobium congolense]|uniref:C69 family dipeptidase n=1 Tax=Halanaerobium congolense TaxID=54121 RepID=UPI0010E5287F|nr:C69 family dipeptidase [Halanaerobium congolense]TDP09163.1 dipeptidase [Halanaerobium congolense]